MTTWKIIIEDLAKLDLQDAYDWYENEKTGLGERFLDAFEEALTRIERNPFHASSYDENYRSATLDSFPYAFIYLLNETKAEVYVIAISHLHRKPSWFSKRKR
jgi:plasmid stabilization system protein ParE